MNGFRTITSRIGLEIAVFVCGALVMVFEINGSRIIAPYLGSSTYIWTSLIGVILAALSLGYWIGGRTADKMPSAAVLASVLFLAGGLVSITIFAKDVVLGTLGPATLGLALKSLFAALVLFAPASIAFGFVLPFAVRIRLEDVATGGKTVGRLYALSTIGSIVGTFLAGFVLIPFVGSTRTLYVIAGTLFALSLLLAPLALTRNKLTALIFFVFGVAANEMLAVYGWQTRRQKDIDTEYARLTIFDSVDPRTNKEIRVIVNDPFFAQSAIFRDSDDLVFEYTRFFHLASYLRPGLSRSLMIGGAGYSFPRDYLHVYPNATIDVVEIDPRMTEIARNEFRLRDDPRMRIFHTDGRLFLNEARDAGYEAIFVDAFGTLFSVPYHLTTVEAVRLMYEALEENGVVIANIGGALAGDGNQFVRAEVATFRAVFDEVRVYKVKPERPDSDLQNLIIVGLKGDKNVSRQVPSDQIASFLNREYLGPIDPMPILTDDLAPVEYYNSVAHNFRATVDK